jgi:hypothetical protein
MVNDILADYTIRGLYMKIWMTYDVNGCEWVRVDGNRISTAG